MQVRHEVYRGVFDRICELERQGVIYLWENAMVSPFPVPITFVEPACRLCPNIEAIPAGMAHSSAPVSIMPKVAYESPVCGLIIFMGKIGRGISSSLSLRNGQFLSGIRRFAPYLFWEHKKPLVPLHPSLLPR